MENYKDMFKIFNEFIFLDHLKVGVDVKVNDLRNFIINRFYQSIPPSRILTTLSLLDDVVLKLHDKNLEGIQHDMYHTRENVMYMLSFEKFVDNDNNNNDNDSDKDNGDNDNDNDNDNHIDGGEHSFV